MKINWKHSLALTALMLSLTPLAHAQHDVRNGGTPLGEKVSKVVSDILMQAEQSKKFKETIDFPAFKIKLLHLQIKKVDTLPTCMANYPDANRIEVTQDCWDSLKTYAEIKRMVLHEVLGVTSNEASESYQLTDYLIHSVSCSVTFGHNLKSKSYIDEIKEIILKHGYIINFERGWTDFGFQYDSGFHLANPDFNCHGKDVNARLYSDEMNWTNYNETECLTFVGLYGLIKKNLDGLPDASCLIDK